MVNLRKIEIIECPEPIKVNGKYVSEPVYNFITDNFSFYVGLYVENRKKKDCLSVVGHFGEQLLEILKKCSTYEEINNELWKCECVCTTQFNRSIGKLTDNV